MIESSHKQESWVTLEGIEKSGSVWTVHLLVRWNEQQVTRETDIGPQIEYTYEALRFDYALPAEVQPGVEAVEYYLEQAKSAILALAQNLAAQEAVFNAAQ